MRTSWNFILRYFMNMGKENEKLEFKKTTGELKESVISMCAMLNKHGGGEIYIGINKDGTPLGQIITEKTLRDVSQAIANHLEPKIYPQITEIFINDKLCIHIIFSGEEYPYFAYGRAYIRVADEDIVLRPTELENFINKKNEWRGIWDGSLSNNTVTDVDSDVLKIYLDRANRAGRIDFTYTTKEEVLHKLEVVEDGRLKNAADVLFVGSRMLEIQMAIFAGTERLTFTDIKRYNGSITSLIEVAETYIKNNIRWRVVFDGSIKRKEIPEIPMDAVREALVNSYCHRLYNSSQNNEITIYSNRIEIYNPGNFPDGLTPQDFLTGRERSVKRNPLLAQLMYYTKDIESFGTGLKRITDACNEAKVKVEFELLKKGFAVVFYRPDENFIETEKMSIVPLNVPLNVPLSKTEQQVLSIVAENPYMTYEEVAQRISRTAKTAQRSLNSLRKKNIIRRIGAKKDGYWEIVNSDE